MRHEHSHLPIIHLRCQLLSSRETATQIYIESQQGRSPEWFMVSVLAISDASLDLVSTLHFIWNLKPGAVQILSFCSEGQTEDLGLRHWVWALALEVQEETLSWKGMGKWLLRLLTELWVYVKKKKKRLQQDGIINSKRCHVRKMQLQVF